MARTRSHGEILRVVVLDRRDDGLHEFEKNDQVAVDFQCPAALLHRLDDLFHHLGMSVKEKDLGLERKKTEKEAVS